MIICQVFFEEQLKKHDGTCALIQANLDAQPKILKWVAHLCISLCWQTAVSVFVVRVLTLVSAIITVHFEFSLEL